MTDTEVLVECKGVSKKFARNLKSSLAYGLKDISKAVVGAGGSRSNARGNEFWAVKDVSFQLRRGECLGLIGHNGAGKSTLLKILNGLIRPDEGEVIVRGRVGALIELGAGFNPILSGRENVYINGQILGFTRQEIDEKLEDIIEFSEIGDFIDTPVQNYSSGMKVRLGFAVAAQMEPDVLIIDEVLAVGDVGFRIKCYNRIGELVRNSAVIIVSHSMPAIGRIANRGILMNKGEVKVDSVELTNVIDEYNRGFNEQVNSRLDAISDEISLTGVRFKNGLTDDNYRYGEMIFIQIEFETIKLVELLYLGLVFIDKEEKIIASTRVSMKDIKIGNKMIDVKVENLFNMGNYTITVVGMDVDSNGGKKIVFRHGAALCFRVIDSISISASPIILKNCHEVI